MNRKAHSLPMFSSLASLSSSVRGFWSFAGAWILEVGALFLVLISVGCTSLDVNPSSPKANTGYVDLYAQPDDDLSWHVEEFDSARNQFHPIYSDVNISKVPVLRLAVKPGPHRLRVSFLNRVTQPSECDVAVLDGQITPIRVTLTRTGASQVQTREQSRGGTVYGRYGRRTKFETTETQSVTVSLLPQESQPYQTKERAPYAQTSPK